MFLLKLYRNFVILVSWTFYLVLYKLYFVSCLQQAPELGIKNHENTKMNNLLARVMNHLLHHQNVSYFL